MPTIIEIGEHMQQGFCEPFLCRADDGLQYVVKSRSAGVTSLVKEWVGSRLAQLAGLPIPPFEIVTFDPHQAKYSADPEAQNLAACPGFASRYVDYSGDFPLAVSGDVPAELRRKVAWFDWWIANGDRNDGNPNLLWVAHEKRIHLIDHNNAFDVPANLADFWGHHLFRGDRHKMGQIERQMIGKEFSDIMGLLPVIWSEMPESWTNGCMITEQDADTILRRVLSDDFWM